MRSFLRLELSDEPNDALRKLLTDKQMTTFLGS